MRRTSLAEAKSHLSALVDAAEHRHQQVIILRHGKAAAAIVPVDVVMRTKPRGRRFSPLEIDGLLGAFGAAAPDVCAVDELIAGRR
jgi:prevent-host-death family protein